MTIYPIHERFYTFQGEGSHMGRPAFFVRTYGCPVHCPWCDSAGTWHPDHVPPPDQITKMSADQIFDEVMQTKAEIVVITGGEPTIFDLTDLTMRFGSLKPPLPPEIHLETSGAFPIRSSHIHHIQLSPKRWREPLAENVKDWAHEFKLIIEKPEDIKFYSQMIFDLGYESDPNRPIWLHPEWSQRDNREVLSAISEAVKEGSMPYRAGWQLHKCYKVDTEDKRSRPAVPLGGNPAKGF